MFVDMVAIARWAYYWFFRLVFFFRPFSVIGQNRPLLSYARHVPDIAGKAHGGNVKLITLNEAFPEQEKKFNLLYLVSSGLSIRAEAWTDIAIARGIKLVWNQNGVAYPACASDSHVRLNQRMTRFLRRASFVVYQSEFCRQTADRFLGKCQGPSAVVYNAVDTDRFRPQDTRLAGDGDQVRLLVMGSHETPGRVLAALEALALLRKSGRKVTLRIVGRLVWPDARKVVDAAIARLGVHAAVEIVGPYAQKDAPRMYCSSDILVHLKHADPCPSVVIEAMACGLPVVGLNSGGVPELVGGDSGELVPIPQDLNDIYVPAAVDVAGAVERIADDLTCYSMAARSRASACFDEKRWLKKHREIFEQVLNS